MLHLCIGTGKTTALAFIIRAILAKGGTIILSAYTHSAVDNILSKIVQCGIPATYMCRIGSATSVESNLHHLLHLSSDSTLTNNKSASYDDVVKMMNTTRLIAGTSLKLAMHPLIQKRTFDWCIMDEAGQVSQPAALGPLFLCDRFLLVGDHYQLPPLIISHQARAQVNGYIRCSMFASIILI